MKRDAAEYVLRVDDEEVGRIRERTAWFHGFEDEAAAREAGIAARDVLGRWYRERALLGHPATVTPLPVEGAASGDRLLLGDTVVGRITSAPNDGQQPDTYDVEVALPGDILHALAVHLVARLYAELAHRRTRRAPLATTADTPVPTPSAAESRSSHDH